MSSRTRIAVLGAGHLGRFHLRILAGLAGAELIGFVDTDDARAGNMVSELGVKRLAGIDEVIDRCQAAVIATPTIAHAEVAEKLLAAGLDVLVEKPITATVEEGERLVALAKEKGRVLAVGHVERHNPAVDAVLREKVAPRFVESERLATFTPRSLDVDVILDLMIHDLDVLLAMVGEPVTEVRAVGVPVLTEKVDIANVRLAFAGGAVANLTASRVSADRVRKIRVFRKDAYFSIDTGAKEVSGYRLVRGSGPMPEIRKLDIAVPPADPLTEELSDFLRAIRERGTAKVSGEAGLEALRLARRILAEMTT